MTRRVRLDRELVRRRLAATPDAAAGLVVTGRVLVAGQVAGNPATQVSRAAAIVVRPEASLDSGYVSRAGGKLAGAWERLPGGGPEATGRRCLDAGSSTGGFVDVLLRRGATEVIAVDVGYGQLAWALRTDPRVRVLDRTNVRHLRPDDIGGPVDLVTADLSFISLRLALPALVGCAGRPAQFLLLVKPQFEAARSAVPSGGVVTSEQERQHAVRRVAAAGVALGLTERGLVPSPVPGPAGNQEYVLWLSRAGASADDPAAGGQGKQPNPE